MWFLSRVGPAGAGRPARQLDVVAGGGFQRVVADARVLAAHEQHGLRHHLVQLHGVVAGAAGHAVQRHAQRLDRALPALLPVGRARRGGGAHGFRRVAQAAALADLLQLRQHVGHHGVALRIVGRAQVEREDAAPRHHVDRAVGHFEDADGADRVAVRAARCSTYSASSATATAASRRRSIGVVPAWLAMPVTSHWKRTPPLMEVTMPSGRSSSLSTGPCSMWTSTKPR
jgi:hypothetical protein